MKQIKLPETWYLKEGEELEINRKKFKVLKVNITELYDKSHSDYAYEKTLKLSDDYFLTFKDNGINLIFGKIKKLGHNTFDYTDNIKIEYIKILQLFIYSITYNTP